METPLPSLLNPMCTVCKTAKILVIIGALNWGLIGIGAFIGKDLNVVYMVLGSIPYLEPLVYILIGVSGAWMLVKNKKCCKDM